MLSATQDLINARDKRGETPFFDACRGGGEGIVRLLLSRGARQEVQGNDGKTALHHASLSGHVSVVELLCAAPGAAAALALRDRAGHTPLRCAAAPACAAVLRAHGAPT